MNIKTEDLRIQSIDDVISPAQLHEEIPHESVLIAGHNLGKAADGVLFAEEQSEHAADLIAGKFDARCLGSLGQTRSQTLGRAAELVVKSILLHEPQVREPGRGQAHSRDTPRRPPFIARPGRPRLGNRRTVLGT